VRSVTLPADPGSPARARQMLRQVLADADRLDCLDAAELACTELVTNAVLHAHTVIEVTVEVAGAVRVCVRDGSRALPRRGSRDSDATTGRGLALVAALTDQYGVADAGPAGKTVWFTVGRRERTEDELLDAWAATGWEPLTGEPLGEPSTAARTVRLLGLPSALWLAAGEHHDALLRELFLYLARHRDVHLDTVAADRARFALSGAVAAAVEGQPPVAARSADRGRGELPPAPEPIDVELQVPPGTGRDFTLMQDALDTAERLASAGDLLARPGLPEIVAVRDWACEQVVAQLAGIAPVRWTGVVDGSGAVQRPPHPTGRGAQQGPPVAPDPTGLGPFDPATVAGSARGVAAADDAGRLTAVSPGLARVLGWRVDDLVGRRIVALIPPRLRDAHVAGFTRHQSTGETRVLGEPLTVPVLRADGSEVSCRLLLERSEDRRARPVYLAWIEPVDERWPS